MWMDVVIRVSLVLVGVSLLNHLMDRVVRHVRFREIREHKEFYENISNDLSAAINGIMKDSPETTDALNKLRNM